MPNPTLVIGIGGTGLRVLLRTKERFVEAYDQMPKDVMLLELDTAAYQGETRESFNGVALATMGDRVEGRSVMADESEFYRISTPNSAQTIDTVLRQDNPEWQWLDRIRINKTISQPNRETISSGAMTVRPVGRAALFMDYRNVYQTLSNRINRLFSLIDNYNLNQSENIGQIFVVASMAGGIGGGMILDILKMIEHIQKSRGTLPATVSCLLVGGSCFVRENDGQRTLSNTFATLRELDRFVSVSGKMLVKAVPSVMVAPYPVGRFQSTIGPADNIYLFDRPDRYGRTRETDQYGEIFLNNVVTPSIADFIVAMTDKEYTPKFKSLDADLAENLKKGPKGEKGYFPYMSAGVHTLIFPERDVRWTAGLKLLSIIWDEYLVRPIEKERNHNQGADLPPISVYLWGRDENNIKVSQLMPYVFTQSAFQFDPVIGRAANNSFISTVVRSALTGEISLPPKYPNLLAFFTKGRTKIARVWALVGIPSTSKETYDRLTERGERVAEWFDKKIETLDNTNNKSDIDRWRLTNWGPGPVGSEELVQGDWLKFIDKEEIIRGHKQDFTSVIISVVEELLNDKDENGRILPYRLEYARRVLDRLDQLIDIWLHSKDGKNTRSLLSEYFDADLTTETEKRRKLTEIDPTKNFSAYRAAMIEYAKARREVFAKELLVLLCTDLKNAVARMSQELDEWRDFLRQSGRMIKEQQEEHRVNRERKLRLPIRTYVTDEKFEAELFGRYKDESCDIFRKAIYWSRDGDGGLYLRESVFSKPLPSLPDNPTSEQMEQAKRNIALTSSEVVSRAIQWACTKEGNPDRRDATARPPLRDMAGPIEVEMANRILDYYGQGNAQKLVTALTHETQIASLCPVTSNWQSASRMIYSCVLPRFSTGGNDSRFFFNDVFRGINNNTSSHYHDRKIIHDKADNPRHAFAIELATGFRLQDHQGYRMYLETYLKDIENMNALHCFPEETNASTFFEPVINATRKPREKNDFLNSLDLPTNTLLNPVITDVLQHRKRLEQFIKARALGIINVKEDGDLYLYPGEKNGDYRLSKMRDVADRDNILSDFFYDFGYMNVYPDLNQVIGRITILYALRSFTLFEKCHDTGRVIDYVHLEQDINKQEKSFDANELKEAYRKLSISYMGYFEKYAKEKPDNFIILAHLGLVLAIVAHDCYESISVPNEIAEKEVTKVDLPEEKNAYVYHKNASSRPYFVATYATIDTRKIKLSIRSTSDFIRQNQKYSEVTFLINAPGFFMDEGQNNTAVPVSTNGIAIDIALEAKFSGKHEVRIEPFLDKTPYTPISLIVLVKKISTKDPLRLPDPLRNRVVPQPDVCVRTYVSYFEDDEEKVKIDYFLYSSNYTLHFPGSTPAGSITINKSDLRRVLVRVEKLTSLEYTDEKYQKLSFVGHELYDLLFSNTLKKYYMEIYKSNLGNILILSDPSLWIPWELIKPYGNKWEHDFLGKQFNIGKWIEGWGALRQDAFPIGQVCLTGISEYSKHYSLSEWQNLLNEGDISRLNKTLFVEWDGGIPAAMEYHTPVWGLHLEDIPEALVAKSAEIVLLKDKPLSPENVRSYALNLHTKRPLVTFGMRTHKKTTTFTHMEEEWLPTFIQSGASAFVGTLWAVQPEVDQLFWRIFYQEIWSGSALGKAVKAARQRVSEAYPKSIDGMSYYLVGDPMSVGYIPPLGEAFVTLECLEHNVSQPMVSGKKYLFQASIRNSPPIWYKDRLYQSTDNKWNDPKLQIIGSGYDAIPSKLMAFIEVSPGNLVCKFELVPKEQRHVEADELEEEVFFNFLSGTDQEIIKSIALPVTIKSSEAGNE